MTEFVINNPSVELKARNDIEILAINEKMYNEIFEYLEAIYPADDLTDDYICKYRFKENLRRLSFCNKEIKVEETENGQFIVYLKKSNISIFITYDTEKIFYYDETKREICRFTIQEYEMAIAMLGEYSGLLCDVKRIKNEIPELYEVSTKSTDIIKSSLMSLCNAYYSKKNYLLKNQEFTSEIIIRPEDGKIYSLLFIHRFFIENPEKIIALIRNPEEVIVDGYICTLLLEINLFLELDLVDWDYVKRGR